MHILTPLITHNFKKILGVDPELWGCTIFGHKMTHLPQIKFFSEKPFIWFPYISCPLSWSKISKKSLGRIQSYEDAPFLGPKWPVCPEREFFFRKLISKTCFSYSRKSTCRKSESDVNALVRYWRLKNTEI